MCKLISYCQHKTISVGIRRGHDVLEESKTTMMWSENVMQIDTFSCLSSHFLGLLLGLVQQFLLEGSHLGNGQLLPKFPPPVAPSEQRPWHLVPAESMLWCNWHLHGPSFWCSLLGLGSPQCCLHRNLLSCWQNLFPH